VQQPGRRSKSVRTVPNRMRVMPPWRDDLLLFTLPV
jgi:hypothetical protein